MRAARASTTAILPLTAESPWIPSAWIGQEPIEREHPQTKEHTDEKGVALVSLLRSCAKNKDLCRGVRAHDDILRHGLLSKCSDALVTMYAKCGALTKAQKLLDIHKSTNVFTWTALISSYTQNGDSHGALDCFEQMQHEGLSPDAVTFTSILTACAQSRAIDRGEKFHDEIVKQGLPANDVVLGTALVDMYAKFGALPKAQQALEELPARDIVSWNALIAGYAEEGHGEQVLHCFQQLHFEALSPTAVTFTSVLKGCSSIGAAAMGARIHDEVVRRGLLKRDVALGNALIDMYAKCGALIKAQKVLDELPMRDVVSWSALVVGYAQHGQSEQILTCYERIQGEGLSPNAVICACILKACGSMGTLEKGGEIHQEIVREGLFGNDTSLGSALIDMYAKCGSLTKAHKVLEELPVRDALSWSALIMAYVQQGEWQKAISCFEQMRREGLTPNAVALTSILKAYGNLGESKKGKDIHDEILREGQLGSDTVLGNSLVDMYSKCGSLSRAQQVLEELPFRDIVSWTALISGYTEKGMGEEALNCFEQMQQEGISPNALTYACVLKACGSIGDTGRGAQIHDDIVRQGLLVDNIILGNALMHMYIRCGAVSKAHRVLEGLPVKDVASWSSLIAGYVQEGQPKQAITCFDQMQDEGLSPSNTIYLCALKACGCIRDVKKGEEIHDAMAKQGLLGMDTEFGGALVDMYAKCGAMEMAEQLLEELHVRDAMVWNALIAGYAKQGRGEEACGCFELMQLEGVSADAVTFSCALKACASIGVGNKGEIIHDEIVRQGLLANDMVLGTAVVDMYAKCGALSKAWQVLEGLPARDIVTWSTVIIGYVQQGQAEQALSCYARMQSDGLSPDMLTFVGILKACGSMGAVQEGGSFHHEIVRRQGLLGSCHLLIGTAIIDMYAKCGALLKAWHMLRELPDRDAIAWSALISGYAQHGQGEQALKCFELMRREGLCPDAALFSCVLSACSLSSLMEDAQMYLEVMDREFGVKPTVEHFTCMIDLLGRMGHLDKAVGVIDKMSSSSNVVWSALLGACRKWGDVKVGKWAFEQAIKVDKNEAAFYILMADIYRAAGLQEDAQDIEAMRKDRKSMKRERERESNK